MSSNWAEGPPFRVRRGSVRRGRLPRARSRHSGGQSLVEFALVLPVLLLLTLVALDFGRVYLGYINLQNMTRIAANYAANNPTAWGATPNATIQTRYESQIVADAAAINCELPEAGGAPVLAAPTFTDVDGNGSASDVGDQVTVGLTCKFGVITPVIADILGNTIDVSAESSFPVKTGMSATGNPGGGGGGGGAPNADFTANGAVASATSEISGVAPFDVEFRDTSGGAPTAFAWDFGDGATSTAQDPLNHTFDCPDPSCSYTVELTASNGAGSDSISMLVTVIGTSDVDFTADRQSGEAPLAVTFSDASTPGGTDYAWDFGDGATTSGGATTANHTYTAAGTYTVSLTVTYPAPIGPQTLTKAAYITVSPAMCVVPSLIGVRFNNADEIWHDPPANFTGDVLRAPGAPNGNFIITAQDKVATDLIPCDNDVTVSAP
jgi:PKD repeat protein